MGIFLSRGFLDANEGAHGERERAALAVAATRDAEYIHSLTLQPIQPTTRKEPFVVLSFFTNEEGRKHIMQEGAGVTTVVLRGGGAGIAFSTTRPRLEKDMKGGGPGRSNHMEGRGRGGGGGPRGGKGYGGGGFGGYGDRVAFTACIAEHEHITCFPEPYIPAWLFKDSTHAIPEEDKAWTLEIQILIRDTREVPIIIPEMLDECASRVAADITDQLWLPDEVLAAHEGILEDFNPEVLEIRPNMTRVDSAGGPRFLPQGVVATLRITFSSDTRFEDPEDVPWADLAFPLNVSWPIRFEKFQEAGIPESEEPEFREEHEAWRVASVAPTPLTCIGRAAWKGAAVTITPLEEDREAWQGKSKDFWMVVASEEKIAAWGMKKKQRAWNKGNQSKPRDKARERAKHARKPRSSTGAMETEEDLHEGLHEYEKYTGLHEYEVGEEEEHPLENPERARSAGEEAGGAAPMEEGEVADDGPRPPVHTVWGEDGAPSSSTGVGGARHSPRPFHDLRDHRGRHRRTSDSEGESDYHSVGSAKKSQKPSTEASPGASDGKKKKGKEKAKKSPRSGGASGVVKPRTPRVTPKSKSPLGSVRLSAGSKEKLAAAGIRGWAASASSALGTLFGGAEAADSSEADNAKSGTPKRGSRGT
jgi:hypothetical protein